MKISVEGDDGVSRVVDTNDRLNRWVGRVAGLVVLPIGGVWLYMLITGTPDWWHSPWQIGSFAMSAILTYAGAGLLVRGEFPPGVARLISGLLAIGFFSVIGMIVLDWLRGRLSEGFDFSALSGSIAGAALFGFYAIEPLLPWILRLLSKSKPSRRRRTH